MAGQRINRQPRIVRSIHRVRHERPASLQIEHRGLSVLKGGKTKKNTQNANDNAEDISAT